MYGKFTGLGKAIYSTQRTVSITLNFFILYIYFYSNFLYCSIYPNISLIFAIEYVMNILMKMFGNDKFLSDTNYNIRKLILLTVLENNTLQLLIVKLKLSIVGDIINILRI